MSDTATEQLKKLYDSQLTSTKEKLYQAYDQNVSNLDAQKAEAARLTQKNLTRTAVESQQAQKNYAELQHAYGLSSGAMSQARLAQDNQLQADLTALRAAQQNTDDNIERQRTLLAKTYTSQLAEAQAANDLARAQALYAEAKEQEDKLNEQQEAAAKLMASAGDFSLYANLYGLTPEQVAALEKAYGISGGSSGNPRADTPTADSETVAESAVQTAQQKAQDVINSLYSIFPGKVTLKEKEAEPADYSVANRHGDNWVTVGSGQMTWTELYNQMQQGKVKEVIDYDRGTITYKPAYA